MSPVDVEGTIRAAGDSEELVRNLVNAGEHSEEIHKTIGRNTEHLSIILGRQEIIDSQSPRLDGFREAITLGVDFIAAV